MTKLWVDPPSGWAYGFPKIWNTEEIPFIEWLVKEGYPKREIDAFGENFHVRQWEVSEDD